ncbi:MAG: SprB repeat-containing protein [Sphingobacterium sp.]|nr:SprB repeat-containing protein [Sphingobacterium sp.]
MEIQQVLLRLIHAGGTGAYTYSWNTTPVQTTQTATGLVAGTYIVTVTDANNCTQTASVTITQPAAALAISTFKVNVSCFGGTTGSATRWSCRRNRKLHILLELYSCPNDSNVHTGLPAGTYTVTVTDANSCTATSTATITQPAELLVGTSQVNVLCFGNSTGTATANPVGGAGSYTYSWKFSLHCCSDYADCRELIAGTYIVASYRCKQLY